VGFEARRRRVLLIDDELPVLRACCRLLRLDCDVVPIEGGEAALDVLAEDLLFDIVLCDLLMPHVDGQAVYEAARARAPELAARFIFLSGGAHTDRAQRFVEEIGLPVLEKPIDFSALRQLMDQLSPL
jgi:two-component system, NtrC family, sensor kinase